MNMDGLGGKETIDIEVGLRRELEDCKSRCFQLEESSKKAEERCVLLESEIEMKRSEFGLLQHKFGALEAEKLAIEDELRVLKIRNNELEEQITRVENGNKGVNEGDEGMKRIVDLTDEQDEEEKAIQLMIENKVLNCEKKKAESEVEVWKVKFKELESRVLELEKSLVLRGGEHTSNGMMKVELGLLEMGAKVMSEARGLKDGLDVATNSIHLHTDDKMADADEKVHAPATVESTCLYPVKGNDLQASGTFTIDTPCKQSPHVEEVNKSILFETELGNNSRVRRRLAFAEGSPNKKMAPSTPGGARPASVGIIDIGESDDDPDTTQLHMPAPEIRGNGMVCGSNDCALGCLFKNKLASSNNLNRGLPYESDDEDMGGYKGNLPFISTPKRRRASNIITSDSESDDDDNVPISKRKTKRIRELSSDHDLNACSATADDSGDEVREPVARRRLVTLRRREVEGGAESSPANLKTSEGIYNSGIPTNKDIEDDDMEEDGSDSEGQSLGGFIVDNSNASDSNASSNGVDECDGDDASAESEDESDGNVDFDEIISRIRRFRSHKLQWEFEADMLADLAKDPELCMKAVCALYRQQTSDEKCSKEALYSNRRGFSQCDAFRGTTLAEFLIDGDPKGDMKKTLKELQEYNPKGPELCRKLASHYSKQLFEIYKNKEDPFFQPS